MLTKMRKCFLLIIVALAAIVLVGCSNIESDLAKWAGSLDVPSSVTGDFVVPTSIEDATVTWESSNEKIISIEGKTAFVTLPDEDTEVALTAKVNYRGMVEENTYVVKVKASEVPTSIDILTATLPQQNNEFVLAVGETATLYVTVEPENASTTVEWTTNNGHVTIDENGVMKGVSIGRTTVTATSVRNSALTKSFEIHVVDAYENPRVLLNAVKEVQEKMPEFINGDYQLPVPDNPEVTAVWKDEDGNVLVDNIYLYNYTRDVVERLKLDLEYNGSTQSQDFTVKIVRDVEINEFTAIKYATRKLEDLMAPYVGADKHNVDGDLYLPTKVDATDAGYEVNISWSSSCDISPNPISEDGTFTKPLDNTEVLLTAYITCGGASDIMRFNVVADGYTKEEILLYVQCNVLPQADAFGRYIINGANIILPVNDITGKFAGISITWETSDATVIKENGRFNPDLDQTKPVTLTATVAYAGTTSDAFAFDGEQFKFEYTVNPLQTDAQRVMLSVSNGLVDTFLANYDWFPFGQKDRECGNKLPLPTTVGAATGTSGGEFDNLAITWTSNEEELFDAEFNLLKQYLRYHEVRLTYSIDIDGETNTSEITVNVGIAKTNNIIYIGGTYAGASGSTPQDNLSQLGTADEKAPGCSAATGYQEKYKWTGQTVYVDLPLEDGSIVRYQLYIMATQKVEVTELAEETFEAADGNTYDLLPKGWNTKEGSVLGNNNGKFIHNATEGNIRIPVTIVGSVGGRLDGMPWSIDNIWGTDRMYGITMDGPNAGFALAPGKWKQDEETGEYVPDTDAGEALPNEFTCIVGVGDKSKGTLNTGLNEHYVLLPAGGYAFNFGAQQGIDTLDCLMCEAGATYFVEEYTVK